MTQDSNFVNSQEGELFSVVLKLQPVRPGLVYPDAGSHVHAAFLDVVRQHDPALAEHLHQPNQRRPFTVSLLNGFSRNSKTLTPHEQFVNVQPGQEYWLRFTMLNGDLFQTFCRHFLQGWRSVELKIGETSFNMSRLYSAPDAFDKISQWAGQTSFVELGQSQEVARFYHFDFVSPTAFSRGQQSWGRHMKLLPEPALVYESLIQQWQTFVPASLQMSAQGLDVKDFVAWCEDNIVVNRVALETRTLQFRRFLQVGFEGQVVYELKGETTSPFAPWPVRLSKFALYTGVGYKTTMGMGQTRVRLSDLKKI